MSLMTYVGVDVSSDTLEVCESQTGQVAGFANTSTGITEALEWLEAMSPTLGGVHLVIEPTSTYHQDLVDAVVRRGIDYSLVNPASTAAYSRVLLNRAKTDRVDARLLAAMGKSVGPRPSNPPDQDQEQLRALRRHLGWLEKECQATRNRLEAARRSPWAPRAVLGSLERTLKQLEQEAKRVKGSVDAFVEHNSQLHEQIELLTSIPGVGHRTAILILSELPSVRECLSAKSWVAFCGLNPEPRESGKTRSSRLSRVGTSRVRAGLYLAAVSALRWNPPIRAMGNRLMARGKAGKVRVVAAMAKLLRICFGVLKSRKPFDLVYHQSALLI